MIYQTPTFSQNEKYAIINMLTMIIEADAIVHPKEVEFMDSILVDFSITTIDYEHMENMDMQLCLTTIKEMTPDNQEIAKNIFSTMASIDGYIDPREKELLESI